MALNIDLVNGGINVYETGEVPRTYFGSIGASGKIYPSGSINGVISGSGVSYVSSNISGLPNDTYEDVQQSSTTGSGYGATYQIQITDGLVESVYLQGYSDAGLGYSVGDLIYIDASTLNSSATGTIVIKVKTLVLDGILFVVGGDDYQVEWSNLVINGTSPTSLQNALDLLSTLLIGVTEQPYKVYTAIISQTGGNAPTATVLQNTIHPDLQWYYNDVGRYGLYAGGASIFPDIYKVTYIQGSLTNGSGNVMGGIYGAYDDSTNYRIYTWSPDSGDYADGLLNLYTIEIRVYN